MFSLETKISSNYVPLVIWFGVRVVFVNTVSTLLGWMGICKCERWIRVITRETIVYIYLTFFHLILFTSFCPHFGPESLRTQSIFVAQRRVYVCVLHSVLLPLSMFVYEGTRDLVWCLFTQKHSLKSATINPM